MAMSESESESMLNVNDHATSHLGGSLGGSHVGQQQEKKKKKGKREFLKSVGDSGSDLSCPDLA